MMNTAVAPEPEMKSQPWLVSSGMGRVNMLAWFGVSTPVQFGPIRQPPTLSTVATICRSSLAPSSLSSLNPADRMMKARVPFCLASRSTTAGQWAAGMARTARSVWGRSLRSRQDRMPWTSSCLGLPTYSSPLKR